MDRARRMWVVLVLMASACSGGSATPPSPTPTLTATSEPSPSPEERYVEVTAATCLNIRAQPSLQAAVVGCAPSGAVLRRTGGPRSADGRRWLKVGGAWQGWAAAEFLTPTNQAPQE